GRKPAHGPGRRGRGRAQRHGALRVRRPRTPRRHLASRRAHLRALRRRDRAEGAAEARGLERQRSGLFLTAREYPMPPRCRMSCRSRHRSRQKGPQMRIHRPLLWVAALTAVASLAVGLGGALAAQSGGAKVSLASTSLGKILVNSGGRTLYLFEKDKNGKSACSGACAGYWPPLITTGKPVAGAGVKASLLGTTKRAD